MVSSSRRRSTRLNKSKDPSAKEETHEEVVLLDSSDDEIGRRNVKSQRKNSREPKDGSASKKNRVEELTRRQSSRSNKFKTSMKEPSGMSIADLFHSPTTKQAVRKRASPEQEEDEESDFTPNKKKKNSDTKSISKQTKSPAVRHTTRRFRIKTEIPVSDDDESESSDETKDPENKDEDPEDEDEEPEDEEPKDEEEDELKIQKIIAYSSHTLKEWKKICEKTNTAEIENGSRWFQNDKPVPNDEDTRVEERFLIKWTNLSFIHCSWETEHDLLDQVAGAKNHLSTFFRKSCWSLCLSI